MALTAALATANRALEIYSTAVQVTSQNISNANTPGYVREEIHLSAGAPFRRGPLIVGSGVRVTSVRQAIDQFLETRIHDANSEAESARARGKLYSQLELEIGELGDADLSSQFNSLLASIDEVINQPELAPQRSNLLEQGRLISSGLRNLRSRLDGVRQAQTKSINNLVDEANHLIDEIQGLNRQIASLEANGLLSSDAGASRTQRYAALDRLSQIIPIHYSERDNGLIDVYSGNDFLIFTGEKQHLEVTSFQDRGALVQTVQFSQTHSELPKTGGELRGVFQGRDEILGSFIDNLDTLTAGFIHEFNRVHSSGEGLDGYTSLTSTNRVSDSTFTLDSAGLSLTPEHGSFDFKVTNKRTGLTQTHTIRIDLDGINSDDTTLEDLRAALDAVSGTTASINTSGQLQLTADDGFEFRFNNDTSGVLAALGINTFFTGDSSSSIDINDQITSNVNLIATGLGGGPADNRNAVRLAEVFNNSVESLGNVSITDYYQSLVAGVGQGTAGEQASISALDTFLSSLRSQREQFSGVSLDEEAVKLIEYQQAFAASARVIKTVDELFQLLVTL